MIEEDFAFILRQNGNRSTFEDGIFAERQEDVFL